MAIERPHKKYGSLIFVRDNLRSFQQAVQKSKTEILTVELTNCTVTSIYKLPNILFKLTMSINFEN